MSSLNLTTWKILYPGNVEHAHNRRHILDEKLQTVPAAVGDELMRVDEIVVRALLSPTRSDFFTAIGQVRFHFAEDLIGRRFGEAQRPDARDHFR
jgi:hypothetical protein